MDKLTVGLVFVLVTINSVSCVNFADCGSQTGQLVNLTVTGCSASESKCFFKTGANATLDAYFKSETNSSNVIVKVWGIILGVSIPFPINPSNACTNWQVECPLIEGGINHLQLSIPVHKVYPRISVQVRFALFDDSNNKLICEQFPVQLQ